MSENEHSMDEKQMMLNIKTLDFFAGITAYEAGWYMQTTINVTKNHLHALEHPGTSYLHPDPLTVVRKTWNGMMWACQNIGFVVIGRVGMEPSQLRFFDWDTKHGQWVEVSRIDAESRFEAYQARKVAK